MHKLLVSIIILSLFFVGGVSKIFNFDSTVKGFMSNTGLPIQLAKIAIVSAIIIEVVAPLIVWFEEYKHKNMYSKYALNTLILFTILATIIYHKTDVSGILKNLSVIGGLTLLI